MPGHLCALLDMEKALEAGSHGRNGSLFAEKKTLMVLNRLAPSSPPLLAPAAWAEQLI